MSSPMAKKPCLARTIVSDLPSSNGPPVIGTHDGTFHCDEVLAISMLQLLPEYKDAVIVRTRDPAKLEKCQIVVDVGSEYDPARLRLDHHQRGFVTTLGEGYKTKLSSAGLVYKHFGRDVLRVVAASVMGEDGHNNDDDAAAVDQRLDKLYVKTYYDFMEHVDAIDNGITVAEGELRYKVDTHLPGRVATLNPAWNEDDSAAALNERFGRALALVTEAFLDFVTYLCKAWWPAWELLVKAFEARETVHPSGKVIYITPTYCPWQDHLFELEREAGVPGHVLYVLYADSKGTMIRIHAVPTKPGVFALRLALPEAWRGLRDDVLEEATGGIPGCTFVHANGFIGGNKTLEGALKMVDVALQQQQQ